MSGVHLGYIPGLESPLSDVIGGKNHVKTSTLLFQYKQFVSHGSQRAQNDEMSQSEISKLWVTPLFFFGKIAIQ